jgi:hypothetical protein
MTTRLQIYNGALHLCGESKLSGLSEMREPRHLLDEVWNDGGVRYCLEQAQWKFAMRSKRFDYDPALIQDFGYTRAFAKPDDWVATSGVFSDEFMQVPHTRYSDEAGFWYSDVDELFIRFVSDHADWGGNLTAWPSTFTEYVKAHFASKIVHKLANGASKMEFLFGPSGRPQKGYVSTCLLTAKNKDAMAGPATFPTGGTWAAARHRGRGGRSDGGNTGSLLG